MPKAAPSPALSGGSSSRSVGFKQSAAPRKGAGAGSSAASSATAARSSAASAPSARVTLHEARTLTGLGSWSAEQVVGVFATASDKDGCMGRETFERLFTRVLMAREERAAAAARARQREKRGGVMGSGSRGGGGGGGGGVGGGGGKGGDVAELRASWAKQQRGAAVVKELFRILDTEQTSLLGPLQLAAAASVLCAGTREARLRTAFDAHDRDGDGLLQRDELRRYLCSVFSLVYATQAGTEEKMGVGWRELGEITAGSAFEQLARRQQQQQQQQQQQRSREGESDGGGEGEGEGEGERDGEEGVVDEGMVDESAAAPSQQHSGMTFKQFMAWCDGDAEDGGLSAALASLSM